MKHSAKKILIVEDDTNFGNILKEYLSLNDYEIALAKNGIEGFGDWSSIVNDLDPFRDGLAAKRIGTYLNWMIKDFDAGFDREDVLKRAAKRYAEAWGSDKVLCLN